MKEEQVNKTIARLESLYQKGQLSWELFETKKSELLAQLGEPTPAQIPQEHSDPVPGNKLSTRDPKDTQKIPASEIVHLVQELNLSKQEGRSNQGKNIFAPSSEDISKVRELREGDLVRGRYRLDRLLGSGGMGQVFLAQDIRFEGRYALKVLHPWVVSHGPTINRFVQEFKIMERLNHSGIVRTFLLDEDTAHESLFFLMEYIEGETLQNVIDRAIVERGVPPFTGYETFQFLEKLADILRYTHSKRILHRDLKPTNIMLESTGKEPALKLLDFGLAKHLTGSEDEALHTGQAGTFFYIAPEQLMGGETATNAADIFSVGVISYQMLTGSLPVAMATPPSELNPDLPKAIDGVLRKAMNVHWQRRYQSIDDYLQALREIMVTSPSTPSPLPPVPVVEPVQKSWLSEESQIPQTPELQTNNPNEQNSESAPSPAKTREALQKSAKYPSSRHSKRNLSQAPNSNAPRPMRSRPYSSHSSTPKSAPMLNISSPSQAQKKHGPISNADRIARLRSHKKSDSPDLEDRSIPSSFAPNKTPAPASQIPYNPDPINQIDAHEKTITRLTQSGDHQFLVSASLDSTIKFWDTQSWLPLHMIEVPPHGLIDLVWSPSGERLAFLADNGNVEVWNFVTKQQENLIAVNDAICLVWSVSENNLFIGCDNHSIQLWNLAKNRCEQKLREHHAPLMHMHRKRRQKYLATGDVTGHIRVWDAQSASPIIQCTQPGIMLSTLAINNQETHLIAATQQGELLLWNLQRGGELLRTWKAHSQAINTLHFHPNDNWFASGSDDQTIALWSLHDDNKLCQFHAQSPVRCLEVSSTGDWLASASQDNMIKTWDTTPWNNL